MRILFAAVAAACCLPANALDLPPKPARLGLCAACHGDNGLAVAADAPHLAGQKESYLRQAIGAYRSGARDVAAMRAATGALSEADIDQLARWYAAQPRDAGMAP